MFWMYILLYTSTDQCHSLSDHLLFFAQLLIVVIHLPLQVEIKFSLQQHLVRWQPTHAMKGISSHQHLIHQVSESV